MGKKKKQRTQPIRWADHAVGLVVVILGVTIAFQLDSWRSDQAAKKAEQLYLEGLLTDLEYDTQLLDTLIRIGEGQQASVAALAAMSLNRRARTDSLAFHLRQIQYSLPFTPQAVTYSALRSEGLSAIRDYQLRRQIAELYEQYYRGAGQYDDALRHHIEQFVQPLSIQKVVYTGPNTAQSTILYDPVFRNTLFPFQGLMSARLDFYQQVQAAIARLKQQIHQKAKSPK